MDPLVDHPPLPVATEFTPTSAHALFSSPVPATASIPSPAAAAAPAANPSPSYGSIPNHPPYAEMITAAILALREKDGSSKKAISKYIDRAYTNLPPAHPALLTHHLKRLKNSGQLVMVKKSYMLPASSPHLRSDATTNPPLPPSSSSFPFPSFPPATATTSTTSTSHSIGRRPGRPPKNGVSAQQPTHAPVQEPAAYEIQPLSEAPPPSGAGFPGQGGFGNGGIKPPQQQQSKRRGRPSKPKMPFPVSAFQAESAYCSQSSYSSPGLVDPGLVNGSGPVPAKRRPGRPPSVKNVTTNSASAGVGGEIPGKVLGESAPLGPTLGKGRPRRPPRKFRAVDVPRSGGRPRGRPRKNAVVAATGQQQVDAAVATTAAPVAAGAKRRGRPPANRFLEDDVVGMKRRGRPPRRGGAQIMSKRGGGRGGGTRRRPGRPRKYPASSSLQMPAQSGVSSEELTRKLEYMQLKVKKAVGLLRPHVHRLDNLDIMTALEDLQELLEMDLTVSRVNTETTAGAPTVDVAALPANASVPTVDVTVPSGKETAATAVVAASATTEEVRTTEFLYTTKPAVVNQEPTTNN